MTGAPVLGIDIGASGAIALLSDTLDLLEVFDMPCLHDGPKGRRTVNPYLLGQILIKTHACRAFVETVGPRPAEGAVGAFAFGRSRGVVEGVLGAYDIPTIFITPPVWKRLVGIAPGKEGAKDAARSLAIRKWPYQTERFLRVKDDGRAEAALIAFAGCRRDSMSPLEHGGMKV